MTCTTLDGIDCSELSGEQMVQCRCDDACPQELIYRYTTASCSPGLSDCIDSALNGATAELSITSNGITYFSGRVQADDNIIIERNGECLPSTFETTVSTTDGEVSQSVLIDSSCSVGPTLLDTFGAFEFAGYTCGDGIPHICYIDVEYEIVTRAVGSVGQSVTFWEFNYQQESREPGISLPVLEPNEGFSKIEPAEFQLCMDTQYMASANVIAIGQADGQECGDTAEILVDLSAGTPFPSPAPSTTPSAFPSTAPSNMPSDIPSSNPSAVPSLAPSTTPSAFPSSSPSSAPSDSPSSVPSVSPSLAPSDTPSAVPSNAPSSNPTGSPSGVPSTSPSSQPSNAPSDIPSVFPSLSPSDIPSSKPSGSPSAIPSAAPSISPSDIPSGIPSVSPSSWPTEEFCEFDLVSFYHRHYAIMISPYTLSQPKLLFGYHL